MMKTYSFARDGGKRLHEYFAVREWRCKDGSDKILIDDDLIPILASVRGYFGAPVVITSGYRTPSYNKGASRSQHMAGCAADIRIAGVRPRDVARYAMTLPGVRGVGLYEYSGQTKGRSFCHIDTGKGLAAETYPRAQSLLRPGTRMTPMGRRRRCLTWAAGRVARVAGPPRAPGRPRRAAARMMGSLGLGRWRR